MRLRWCRLASMWLAAVLVLAGCSSGAGSAERPMLAIGDSIMAWHVDEGASIPDVVADELGREVTNRSVPGGQFLNAPVGLDIRDQYYVVRTGGWEWVIIDGGGNDLNAECGCDECSEIQDALLGPEGDSGRVFEFVDRIVSPRRKVMLVGYYEVPNYAWFGFNQCVDELAEYNRRLALMADQTDNVWFIDAGQAVKADDPSAYEEDGIHPSVEGSELVGRLVAQAIVEADASVAAATNG